MSSPTLRRGSVGRAPGERREAFSLLPEARREALVADVSRPQLAPFVDRLDPDEATDVLGHAGADAPEATLAALEGRRREKLESLLSFGADSAVDSREEVTTPGYPEVDRETAVIFHRRAPRSVA